MNTIAIMNVHPEGPPDIRGEIDLARGMPRPPGVVDLLEAFGTQALMTFFSKVDKNFCRSLAQIESLPIVIQDLLARHEDVDVRRAIATNAGLVNEVAIRLAKDEDAVVRFFVTEFIDEDEEDRSDLFHVLARDRHPFVREMLARSSTLGEEILARLIEDDSQAVRIQAVRHDAAPRSALLKVLTTANKNPELAFHAIPNGNLTWDDISHFEQSEDELLHLRLVSNPNTAPNTVQAILDWFLDRHQGDNNMKERAYLYATQNSAIPSALLDKITTETTEAWSSVLATVAVHPKASFATLDRLLERKDFELTRLIITRGNPSKGALLQQVATLAFTEWGATPATPELAFARLREIEISEWQSGGAYGEFGWSYDDVEFDDEEV